MTVRILAGDARSVLASLPAQSFQCCVTSPPYFGLRDYGVDGQIGLEKTPDEYVSELVAVFREVRRVLRDDGVLWLNLGDSYNAAGRTGCGARIGYKQGTNRASASGGDACRPSVASLKEKDLIGIPWLVAFALRADGWYLRSDVIWAKPNPMPESVTDRPTKAHEHVFLLSKGPRYFYDAEAIAETAKYPVGDGRKPSGVYSEGSGRSDGGLHRSGGFVTGATRNARSVWSITTKPFRGAHFATMPPDLVEKCVKTGSAVGDSVIDPFGGAGTTGLVAGRLGRNAVLAELNPAYAEITKARLTKEGAAWTGDGVAAALARNRQARESLSAAMGDL
ncbi:COG0863 DNA modification methylase [uncultured Caudovirales phage]|uniref:site-specific DNA-methyltransferase (cytosine-N(4)-specific) n=1 Tax=uncultured Caudovirales phage TaxID=2100421 RepID=A0A6J5NT89_9CAUD|nr:COG0863 DNA modification methylase [uncultured Caudovirales phage]